MTTISTLAGTQSGTDCLDSLYDDLVLVNADVATNLASTTASIAALTVGTGCPVSANDTTPGYLNGKLVAGSNISLTEGSDGGNETLTIAGTQSISMFRNQLFS